MSAIQSPIQDLIDRLYEHFRPLRDGKVATYIPELARVDPDAFGIALVTADGYSYEAGDSGASFTIQSISKPIVYGIAHRDLGREAMLKRIGVEPSGDLFNSVAFDEARNRPYNAMVNAGAIAATSLVAGNGSADRFARIAATFQDFTGHPVAIDEAVYRSEARTGHRNRAIAYLELNAGMIEGDVDAHLDLYFRQCAILVSARDLAMIGATLANGGVNPITGTRALPSDSVRDVLSVMTSCGMYDYAGEWELRVGLPAKSGVGGGIMAVLPGQLAIGVFSPRLDEHGNSLRGLRICEELSSVLKLHLLDHHGSPFGAIRQEYRATHIRSKRLRCPAQREALDRVGDAIRVIELQGSLSFFNTEQLIRRILDGKPASHIIFDARRVFSIDPIAAPLFARLIKAHASRGVTCLLAVLSPDAQALLALPAETFVVSLDHALERCENAIIAGMDGDPALTAEKAGLGDIDILAGFTEDEVGQLRPHLKRRDYRKGDIIIRNGACADSLYLLLKGSIDISVSDRDSGRRTRLGAIDSGNAFGEIALIGGRARTADVLAASDVETFELTTAAFEAIRQARPDLHRKLLVAVGRTLSDRLRRANIEIAALSS